MDGAGAMSGVFGIAQTFLNNHLQQERTDRDRRENFVYGEKAANAADLRTRALYNDFYSPEALLKQYKEAGLSPSLMFGGTPGQGGMQGARGTGAAGPTTPFMPFSMVEAAQAAALFAQTKKTKAETENIQEDTKLKDLEKRFKVLQVQEYKTEWNITNTYFINNDGTSISLYEIAVKSNNYEDFVKAAREKAEETGDTEFLANTGQEAGQKILRNIYMSSERFDWNIKTLSSDKVAAEFQEQLIKAMENQDFINLNAKAATGWLKANIQTAELTETQKEAWNNLIDRLGQKGETMRDIVVVLGMILNNAASNWSMPTIQRITHNHNSTTNNYEL